MSAAKITNIFLKDRKKGILGMAHKDSVGELLFIVDKRGIILGQGKQLLRIKNDLGLSVKIIFRC